MDPITNFTDVQPLFLTRMELIRVNIYLQAMGLQAAMLIDPVDSNQHIYDAIQLLINENDCGLAEPFAGELREIINKADMWKQEQEFYSFMDNEVLGEE